MRNLRLLLLLKLSLLAVSLPGQELSLSAQNHALFFAVDDYSSHRDFLSLKNAISDAEGIAEELERMYNFNVDLYKNPTAKEIITKLLALREHHFEPNDQLLIMFSGHGTLDGPSQKGVFVASDNSERHQVSYIRDIINLIPCEHILLLFDACFSGAGDSPMIYKGDWQARRPGDSDASRKRRLVSEMLSNTTGVVISSGNLQTLDPSPMAEEFHRALASTYTSGDGLLTLADLKSRLERVRPVPTIATLQRDQGGGFVFVSKDAYAQRSNSLAVEDLPPSSVTVPSSPSTNLNRGNFSYYPQDYVYVPAANFSMGKDLGEMFFDAQHTHLVNLSGFAVSQYELTFAEYDLFCEDTHRTKPDDGGWGRGSQPVINVSWYDAIAYCNWLSQKTGKNPVYEINGKSVAINYEANGYRLPSEAEWEYLASYRNATFGNSSDLAEPLKINFDGAHSFKTSYSLAGVSRGKTVPIGSLNSPNQLGLHDLSGNVAEWCNDLYSSSYYQESPSNNPTGPTIGSRRVVRGGSFQSRPDEVRAFVRSSMPPEKRSNYIGFRLVWKK
jgi:formylglycine-generating enzyme required for sulfatase activity